MESPRKGKSRDPKVGDNAFMSPIDQNLDIHEKVFMWRIIYRQFRVTWLGRPINAIKWIMEEQLKKEDPEDYVEFLLVFSFESRFI